MTSLTGPGHGLAGSPELRAATRITAGPAEPPALVRVQAWAAAAGPVVALAAMLYAHLLPGIGISPLTGLVSDYALSDGGHAAILVATLALAWSCLWSAYGMAQADPARTAATRVLLIAAALGLVLTAIFPTDPTAGVSTMGGELHRWSSALVFTGLPCAAWMLARNRPEHPRWGLLKGMALVSGLLLAGFLAAHPAALTSDLIAGGSYHGLLQRLLLFSDMALLLAVATALPFTGARHQGRNVPVTSSG
ncbi:DUF998 domain-containing protein [Streptosporangium sp. KLBMP 9127]|nr:DUF998 domain-containing protein [Streptosporangium sp. KLBMP 9127]